MRRFYKQVSVAPETAGWRVQLDGKPIRTPAKAAQIVPSAALAQVMALEWSGQGEEIDPTAFIFRDMADYAIDVVARDPAAAAANLLRFAETDTLCYRAEAGDALLERQIEVWEPLLRSAELRWDIHFERVGGILHRPQPQDTLSRMAAVLAPLDPFIMGALTTLTTLTASLVIGLAALEESADGEALWAAANLEEDWQAELWGKDAEALALRARRMAEFEAAIRFAGLVRLE
jgi:chaperone required for assembly of F1-ATPase